jgi:hypothetical protein
MAIVSVVAVLFFIYKKKTRALVKLWGSLHSGSGDFEDHSSRTAREKH